MAQRRGGDQRVGAKGGGSPEGKHGMEKGVAGACTQGLVRHVGPKLVVAGALPLAESDVHTQVDPAFIWNGMAGRRKRRRVNKTHTTHTCSGTKLRSCILHACSRSVKRLGKGPCG